MGKEIFVSYKYGDSNVRSLKDPIEEILQPTKVRNYIDEIQRLLSSDDNINKGEADGGDLSTFKDSTIESKLRKKIFDSSVTLVAISPHMKDTSIVENDQWIPWEISYSLKEHTRGDKTSQTNALLGVILPDRANSYSYFVSNCYSCSNTCRIFSTNSTFQIIRDNMFNISNPSYLACSQNQKIYSGYSSYFHMIKWDDFKNDVSKYIDIAVDINSKKNNYEIVKTVK